MIVVDALVYAVLCLSTVIWCIIKIRAHLKQHLNYASHATKDMSSQLNWALMAQVSDITKWIIIRIHATFSTPVD